MASKIRRYWDSDCCFGWLTDQAGRKAQCDRVIVDAEVGNCEIVLSSWNFVEVLHFKGAKRPFPKDDTDKIRKFFNRSCFIVANVDKEIAELAQDLFWQHDIMPDDAIHIATALYSHANYYETYENSLLDKSKKLGGDPLLILQNPGADLIEAEKRAKAQLQLPGPLSS